MFFLFSSRLLAWNLRTVDSFELGGEGGGNNEMGHVYERRGTWRLRLLTERWKRAPGDEQHSM